MGTERLKSIKFRAKRVDNHPVFWAYGYLVKTPITAEWNDNKDGGHFFDSGGHGRYCIVTNSGVAHEIDVETVGQWTGYLDKNGKEIYDKDVVKLPQRYDGDWSYQPSIELVKWLEGEFWVSEKGECDWEQMEIIGDIYSNPKLNLWETTK